MTTNANLSWIANYIWGIADDVLRDLYVRGKYRDVILPMTVLRRLDAVLEDSKQAVLDMQASLEKIGLVDQDEPLRQAAGQDFYNTSRFALRDLRARANRQQLEADFRAWLDGFSPNVQGILENFEFRNQVSRLSRADALGTLIEKLTSPDVNLSPAPVHNGSSLFTGDAGQGESNIRRWIIENDWLEAIVALPLNMFYNTGIATYVWVITNRKPEHRRGKVQLIDATEWYRPLRKNLGKKNCELGEEDIRRICETFLAFEETEQSKIFDNAAFGYWKVTVERPLRLEGIDPNRAYKAAEIKKLKDSSERSETAPPVIKKIHKRGTEADPLRARFEAAVDGRHAVVEYEPDTDLRDTEQIPLQEKGGIEAFLRREVVPYAADAWYQADSVKVGYEISFTRYFYKPQPMRTLEEIAADIMALEKETEGLLGDLPLVREPPAAYGKPRIYVDTSVIGGCLDDEFREQSTQLFEVFRQGDATMLISNITLDELADASAPVRRTASIVPQGHTETLAVSREARELADAYITAGAIGGANRTDALHIAIATLAETDVLASWNFRHMVNWRRIRAYNEVNRNNGYPAIDIRTPEEIVHD